jgi:ABC-type polysaccharide/polyol phosphate export systems, permease component
MKKFFYNIKKYFRYALYSAKADLKAEVAGSHLNWLWWILEPLCFMMIYMFIASIVFKSSEQHFQVFVFIGLTAWDYFNKNVTASVKIVTANKGIVSKIYIPKYILVLQKSFVNLFKMFISWILIFIFMIILKVPFTFGLLYIIPILIVFYIVTFGICNILLHFGIFIEDLANVTNLGLKLVFYLSGVFYSITTRVPKAYKGFLLTANPAAFIIDSLRKAVLYNQSPVLSILGLWLVIGILLSMVGILIIHKYENSYAKVI